MKDILYTS